MAHDEKTQKTKAAQDFVPIQEVRGGVMILKDGNLVGAMLASSLNFALKSADEQQAIILQFQSFLNALDFSVEIVIQSRQLDIRPYIAMLESRYKDELGDLMKIQIKEYIQFVKNFVEQTNIMTKTFFVIVPFSPTVASGVGNPLAKLTGTEKAPSATADHFEENRTQLEERLGSVAQGLTRCGIRSVPLGTEEITELFYKTFNPGDTEKPIVPVQ